MTYFPEVSKIRFEGPSSQNPLSYKYYNPDEVVAGKRMEDHLRFSIAYWHTLVADGSDPFGVPTMQRPWNGYKGLDLAKARVEALFEFAEKLGLRFFAFHDRDIAPEGDSLAETNRNLDHIVAMLSEYMKSTSIKLLWNTANMFSHPRYVHGAATAPNAHVFAYAAAQVKKSLDIGKELGSENYVFWGGREGYSVLLNTAMEFELDNLARFYRMAIDYAKEIGYTGQFLIEPKPKEPTKHQYDYDAASAIAFLYKYDLIGHFQLNIEANHATLAGHTFQHELRVSRIHGLLGSVDANQGDELLGWDTDEFPTNLYDTTLAMYEILKNGGLHRGGLNFDAKTRRASFDTLDLFYGHIAGVDSFARGLKIAAAMIEDGVLEKVVEDRYKSYEDGIGKDIVSGTTNFYNLEKFAMAHDIQNESGRQELLMAILNQYLSQTH
jgi:xylose isomerase